MSLESEPFRREVTLLFYSHKALRSCLLVPLGINDNCKLSDINAEKTK